MPTTPEALARKNIDALLVASGWVVQDRADMNLGAGRGVAVREFPLKTGYADYLLFVDRKAIGAIEAKKEGTPLTGVEVQSAKYGEGLPAVPPAWRKPLPFLYESTGVETYFTNGLDPEPRSRRVFAFHRPETLAEWVILTSPLRARMQNMPPLLTANLWSAQVEAVTNLEQSFAENRPRALIQMATGSGKTFTAVTFIYRLIKFGGAKRVLFLVDRNNLGRQTLTEFQQYVTPDDGRKFTELYNVQHLQSNTLDDVSKVCITSIQRLYSMLSGEPEFDVENEERSLFEIANALENEPPKEVRYNSRLPIEYFDVIVTDECHRSIYNLWRGVLEYFDAFTVGLTATPNKQTFGFFNQNLVMEYSRRRAIADGVNVDGQVYRIRTAITEQGSKVEAGYTVDKRDKLTREIRWQQLDDDLTYAANQLDRDVVAVDQIRTVIRTFRDKLFTEIMPDRTDVPKTLIFAKDDSHADDIVRITREEFGKGNDFCQKITYSVTGISKENLISTFRNSYYPRIAVTVDMIATGTDIKPLEILLFLRQVRSAGLFEQMLGRGTRVINSTDLQAVTPDALTKTHFVIVDAVGVVDNPKVDVGTLNRKRSISFEKLLEGVALGARDDDALISLAERLARLEKQMTAQDRYDLAALVGAGLRPAPTLRALANKLLDATDADVLEAAAIQEFGEGQTAEQRSSIEERLKTEAVSPFDNPRLRQKLIEIQKRSEQLIDTVSQDRVLVAEFSNEQLRATVESFRQYLEANRDEITALQILLNQPRRVRALTLAQVRELAEKLQMADRAWATESLWQAYAQLERGKVRGVGVERTLTDVVSLVRHAVQLDDELIPYTERVRARYAEWLRGKSFTPEQRVWLDAISEAIGVNASIELDDFEYGELFKKGGRAAASRAFGNELPKLVNELNEVLGQ